MKNLELKRFLYFPLFPLIFFISCNPAEDLRVTKSISSEEAKALASQITSQVNPVLDPDLNLEIWAVDSIMTDAISIQVTDKGELIYTHTNRQKDAEFDIRGHQDWEIRSIALQNIDDKRAFLRSELSPERSAENEWLSDLNGDGSHDWRDMLVPKEEIFRLTDTDNDGLADFSERLVEDFNEEVTDVAGAVMMVDDELFVGAGPDMWRLWDTNGDGVMDEKESISHGYGIHIGFGAHGMSGLEMGPDGRVYWGIGDIGFSGVGDDGKEWHYPNRGVIARANPDGSDFEIFAMGVRNTHEFVFDEFNNLISVDNDGDHPGEKERLVYITNGSDTGWRTNWQFGKYRDPKNNPYKVWMDEKMYLPRWEGQAAFITPCIANYVSGPTGMVYNPGTALGSKWVDTFFVVEFVGNATRSALHAFKLNPKGASFELASTEKVVSGILPTGIDFGPDGALYLADWIDGWGTKPYGRIWKMSGKSNDLAAIQKETEQLLQSDFKREKVNSLKEYLSHQDLRVRRKSQFELAKRSSEGGEVFSEILKESSNQLAKVHSIVGLSQLARLEDMKYAELILPSLSDSDPEIRAQAAKWLGDIRYDEAGDLFIEGLKDENPRVQFFNAEALGRIAFDEAKLPLIELIKENNDEDAYLRHAATLALARIGDKAILGSLSTDPSRAARMGAVIALRRLESPELSRFLNDEDELIVTEAARAIHDDFSVPEALPALADLISTTPFDNEPLIRRIISANQRVGEEKNLIQTLNYISKPGIDLVFKEEAIAAVGTWANPSLVDRVDGRFRGEVKRDGALIREKASQPLMSQLKSSKEQIRIASAKALGQLTVLEASGSLLSMVKNDPRDEVKIESLFALKAMDSPNLGEAISSAIRDQGQATRVAGLSLIDNTDLPIDQKVTLLTEIIQNRSNAEKQSALLTLGNLEASSSLPIWQSLLTDFAQDKVNQAVWVELEEAIEASGSEKNLAEFNDLLSKKAGDETWKKYAGALAEGNVRLGRSIFLENQTAQCIKCHAYDDMGGNAGPNLSGVAKKLSREELLIALVEPSARIAPGFGQIKLELKDGTSLSGTFLSESSEGISISKGAGQDTLVSNKAIAEKIFSMSSMPPMGTLLSKRELRDVLSYLSTLIREE